MRILTNDIGAGTQDILLFDSSQPLENAIQLIMPSPTQITAARIHRATASQQSILLQGVTMGGGPCQRALKGHLDAGLAVYATPEAAQTFNDDVAFVASWGVNMVSEDEAKSLKDVVRIETKDVDLAAISGALRSFDVDTHFDAVGIAVLDHGNAPPGVSDRVFRFQHLRRVVEKEKDLLAFAYLSEEVPPYLTRMKAVVKTYDLDAQLLLLDTGAAAALGSLEDREVAKHPHRLLVNLGNSHTLAFHMDGNSILGLLEHHTGSLTRHRLEGYLEKLGRGVLEPDEIFNDGGHGSFFTRAKRGRPFISVTGPRRLLMRGSRLGPYFAAPYGDMMLTGCFGLLRAFAHKMPDWREEIDGTLRKG
ncbi:MAG: DUF1786 domain-containing protein [Chloroflexi bacterium]|nr:DUF1786 domain-containing protein [Chloroflexota bacterium]